MENVSDFVKVNLLDAGANNTYTENGALSYATTGMEIINQFGKAASFRGRDIETVWQEQSKLWSENKELALKFPFYLRMITRKQKMLANKISENVQKGQGCKDEAFKRLLWIAKYHPEDFYLNLWLLPIIGSWKDLWVLMAFEGASEYLDNKQFFQVIASGIFDNYHKELVKKYMPRIRSRKRCTTWWSIKTNELAKEFAKYVGWTQVEYRKFKSTGIAHEFQRTICAKMYDNIKWNTIPGKALLQLVSGNFLQKHGLEDSYINWIKTQDVVKFNGYPFELGRKMRNGQYKQLSRVQKMTIDAQFDNLIKTANIDGVPITGNVLCALDTSGSMTWVELDKSGTQPIDVCMSLGIYFSELNKGGFHNVVASFDDTSSLLTINGTFTDKWFQLDRECHGYGSTNFQSIIDLLVETRQKHPEIKLEDYPTTLLVVSDMQFNCCGSETSNYQRAMDKLSKEFPKEFVDNFKIIWWNCTSRPTQDFPSTMEDGGTYFFSGFDGAVISFLLSGEIKSDDNKAAPSMVDILNTVLNQEILCLIHTAN